MRYHDASDNKQGGKAYHSIKETLSLRPGFLSSLVINSRYNISKNEIIVTNRTFKSLLTVHHRFLPSRWEVFLKEISYILRSLNKIFVFVFVARRLRKNLKNAALCRDLIINGPHCTKTKFRVILVSHYIRSNLKKKHDSRKLHTKQYALQLKLERKQDGLQKLISFI